MENHTNRLITREEVADMLGLKPQTLAKWAHSGGRNLKMIRVGSRVRYRIADVEEFIASNEVG